MKIIGIEGTALAGKTTVSSRIRRSVPEMVILVPCFMHFVYPGGALPPIRTRSKKQQLDAVRFFADIECHRMALAVAQAAEDAVLILDRTIETLLAHTYALDRWDKDFLLECWKMIEGSTSGLPKPHRTIHLSASPEVVGERAALRRDLPGLFKDESFIDAFNAYFADARLADWPVVHVDAGGTVDNVAEACISAIE